MIYVYSKNEFSNLILKTQKSVSIITEQHQKQFRGIYDRIVDYLSTAPRTRFFGLSEKLYTKNEVYDLVHHKYSKQNPNYIRCDPPVWDASDSKFILAFAEYSTNYISLMDNWSKKFFLGFGLKYDIKDFSTKVQNFNQHYVYCYHNLLDVKQTSLQGTDSIHTDYNIIRSVEAINEYALRIQKRKRK